MSRTIRLVIAEQEGLRLHLDNLNETGKRPVAVGIDSTESPFLITLMGPYTEYEDVFFDSPWQSDLDMGERVDGEWVPKKPHCEECRGMVHGMKDIKFPVTILAVAT